jgi:hypothetical protein
MQLTGVFDTLVADLKPAFMQLPNHQFGIANRVFDKQNA